MKTLGELLKTQRNSKRISISSASRNLHIKREHLEALESEDWSKLPEPAFIKGFIKNYANYLGLDVDNVLAVYRRGYDEKTYQSKSWGSSKVRRWMISPNKIITLIVILAILIFVGYLTVQYSSILSAPKLEVISPQDDSTTAVSAVQLIGKTEKDVTVSVDGEFVPVDAEGNFSRQIPLSEGANSIVIITSKRLSPKTKITRTIRLSK